MKTINLYFDFEFTSLSPDAQPISLGIVSDAIISDSDNRLKEETDKCGIEGFKYDYKSSSKSFYAEFSDFDIDRCDDWVKENVVSKLKFNPDSSIEKDSLKGLYSSAIDISNGNREYRLSTPQISNRLKEWLEQFNDYNIQFVCDCGTFDWYWMLQLLDKRIPSDGCYLIPGSIIPDDMTGREFVEQFNKKVKESGGVLVKYLYPEITSIKTWQKGLPDLPKNISPVPQDLNDLIAFKKEITVREAFDINREELAYGEFAREDQKHNALWDAQVIKCIYNKLM